MDIPKGDNIVHKPGLSIEPAPPPSTVKPTIPPVFGANLTLGMAGKPPPTQTINVPFLRMVTPEGGCIEFGCPGNVVVRDIKGSGGHDHHVSGKASWREWGNVSHQGGEWMVAPPSAYEQLHVFRLCATEYEERLGAWRCPKVDKREGIVFRQTITGMEPSAMVRIIGVREGFYQAPADKEGTLHIRWPIFVEDLRWA